MQTKSKSFKLSFPAGNGLVIDMGLMRDNHPTLRFRLEVDDVLFSLELDKSMSTKAFEYKQATQMQVLHTCPVMLNWREKHTQPKAVGHIARRAAKSKAKGKGK